VDGASEEQDECTYLFLDPGCSQTCHGEKWMERFMKHTGYKPDWLHAEVEMEPKPWASESSTSPWRTTRDSMFSSTEIKGSSALLFLSLPSQERLGLVMDFGASEIYSRLLHMTFKAVRGRRNRPLGLKMHPCDQVHPGFKIPQEPVALMADNEGDEGAHGGMGAQTAPWKRQRGEQGPSGASFLPGRAQVVTLSGLATQCGANMEVEALRRSSRFLCVEKTNFHKIHKNMETVTMEDDDDAATLPHPGAQDTTWIEDAEEEIEEIDERFEEEPEKSPPWQREPDGGQDPNSMEDFWEKTGNVLVRPRAAPQEAPLPNYEQDGTAGRLEQVGVVKDYEAIRGWGDARGAKTPDMCSARPSTG